MTVVLDTSAVAAVIFGEPDAEAFASAMLRSAGELAMSAASAVEIGIVVEAKQGPAASADLTALLEALAVRILAVDAEQAAVALAAWRRFGKGQHAAALNLGDCFAYAAAKVEGAPLLFKGTDFSQTDIAAAL